MPLLKLTFRLVGSPPNFAFLLLVAALAGCAPGRPAKSTYEATGSQAGRVAMVSRMVNKHTPLPSTLMDAHFVQQQVGDNILGPADFIVFYVLSVATTDLAAWRAVLTPLESENKPPAYVMPETPRSWWLSSGDFPRLEFYSPKSLTGRISGWVGIEAASGRIFVYSFTM